MWAHDKRMAKTRRNNRRNNTRKNKSRRGGGYLTDQQYFNPDVLPPSSLMPPLTSLPTSTDIRPVMLSTAPMSALMAGGGALAYRKRHARRRTRRSRGGFSPSVMGSFIANAQAAIVPAALYLVYNQVAKPGTSVSAKLKKAFRGGGKDNVCGATCPKGGNHEFYKNPVTASKAGGLAMYAAMKCKKCKCVQFM